MHLLCVCMCVRVLWCVPNEMYSILMIRKGTLKLFSFWKWKEGRFGVVTGCVESRRGGWSEGEKLEHGMELGCGREDTGAGGGGAAERPGDAGEVSPCPWC